MDKIMSFLFTDPVSAGYNTPSNHPETFHFYLPWIIVCSLLLLIPIYYGLEGRKRFFGHHTLHKYLADRFVGQLWPLGLVGFFLIIFRYTLDSVFLSFRVWRYAWALWAVAIVVYWAYYFAVRYSDQRRAFLRQRTLEKYHPQPRRRAVRAGSR